MKLVYIITASVTMAIGLGTCVFSHLGKHFDAKLQEEIGAVHEQYQNQFQIVRQELGALRSAQNATHESLLIFDMAKRQEATEATAKLQKTDQNEEVGNAGMVDLSAESNGLNEGLSKITAFKHKLLTPKFIWNGDCADEKYKDMGYDHTVESCN